MKIEKLESVIAKLKAKALASKKDSNASVIVGYTAQAALYVHEMIQKHAGEPRASGIGVYWGPHGQPKFLEGPARELKGELASIVRQTMLQGKSLSQALMLAGLRLQRESMQRVPVEYGNLRASAFTRREK